VTVIGVIGELLMTFGVIMLLFVGWKYWLNDIVVGHEQNKSGAALAQQLAEQTPNSEVDEGGIPVGVAPTQTNEQFATLYVPAWGADYSRPIAQGIEQHEVLDHNLGHYPSTPMPGAVGNFAIAGHRMAYGASMQKLGDLKVGDEIVVETADGWYTYRYRSGEYVQPTQVDILASVPRHADIAGGERLMTLMTCNPVWSTAERMIAYAVFDRFTPRADGPPESIRAAVEAARAANGAATGPGAGTNGG